MTNADISKLRKINSQFKSKTSMDWSFDWKNYDINKLVVHIKSKNETINIFGLASFHCNGYFREKAIEKLSEINDASVFPFILLRTNDYVDVIRENAKKVLLSMINKNNFASVVKYYSLIMMSSAWKYSVYNEIREKLNEIENELSSSELLSALSRADSKGKVYCYQILIEQNKINNIDLCSRLISESDYYVKSAVINKLIIKFSDKQLIDIAAILYKIKSPSIRIKLIERLFSIGYYKTQQSLLFTLLDRYSKVRNIGLDYIHSMGEFDIIDYYHQVLEENPDNTYAICGLCEYGKKEEYNFLKPYLENNIANLVANVIKFIEKNECDNYIDILIRHIKDERTGISNLSRRLLTSNKNDVNTEEVYLIYRNTDIWHVKENCMTFLRDLSKWDSIYYILKFAYNDNCEVAHLGNIYFYEWKKHFNKSFISPSKKSLSRINDVITKIENKQKSNSDKIEYIKFIIKDYV